MTDLEGYRLQFETEFDNNVRDILPKLQEFTQSQKALMFGVSRKTIYSFERVDGSCRNYWLLFCYRMHAFGDAVI